MGWGQPSQSPPPTLLPGPGLDAPSLVFFPRGLPSVPFLVTCQGLALEQQPLLADGDVQLETRCFQRDTSSSPPTHLSRPRKVGGGVKPRPCGGWLSRGASPAGSVPSCGSIPHPRGRTAQPSPAMLPEGCTRGPGVPSLSAAWRPPEGVHWAGAHPNGSLPLRRCPGRCGRNRPRCRKHREGRAGHRVLPRRAPTTWTVLRGARGDGAQKPAESGKGWAGPVGLASKELGSWLRETAGREFARHRPVGRAGQRCPSHPLPLRSLQKTSAPPSSLHHPPASFLLHLWEKQLSLGSGGGVRPLPFPLLLEQIHSSEVMKRGRLNLARGHCVASQLLHPGPHLPGHTPRPSFPDPSRASEGKDSMIPKLASVLLKYIFWAVPAYRTQHGLFWHSGKLRIKTSKK